MSNEPQDNPWPGFVDVLSATLLVFVFLVIVQLLVIAGVSMKVSKVVSEKYLEQKLEKVEFLSSEVSASPQPDQISPDKINQAGEIKPESHKPQAPAPSLVVSKAELKILYNNLDTLMDADNNTRIGDWINDNANELKQQKVQINASIGLENLSMSTSYFVSFNRAMDIRNKLVEEGVPTNNITVRIHKTENNDQNEVVIGIMDK